MGLCWTLPAALGRAGAARMSRQGMRPLTPGALRTEPETSTESLFFLFLAGFRSEGVNGSSFWERGGLGMFGAS